MRKITMLSLLLCLVCLPFAGVASAARTPAQYRGQGDPNYYEPYTPEQLDNLLAPVALYPDPLLAQVLLAATFPDQIEDAADFVNSYGAGPGIDDQPWDISVKAVAHYPAVLDMMNNQIDWTAAVGQAYVNQSTDTMASVQNLRRLARAEGNLFSTPQQQIVDDGGYIEILPAEPRYIFVPTYDPGVIYHRRVYNGNSFGGFFSFGSGFAIGAWLNYDLDWHSRRVVYNDWHGGGWRQRSRPFVQVNNVYVNNRYQNVVVNRTVVNRQVDFQKVDQFNSVHTDAKFDNRPRGNGPPVGRPNGGNANNNANRDQRPNDGNFNRGGQRGGQGQPPAPTVQQQPPVVQQNNQRPNNNDNRGGQRGREQQGQPPVPTVQQQVPVQQQTPQVPQRNNPPQNNNPNDYRGDRRGGGQNQGGQNQGPQNPAPDRNVRGQGQNQLPPAPPAPQQAPPPPQRNERPNDNPNRGQQNQPPPPARVEPARPAPPPPQPAARPAPPPPQPEAKPAPPPPPAANRQQGGQQGGGNGNREQGGGQKDNNKGNNKDNKDNRDGKDGR